MIARCCGRARVRAAGPLPEEALDRRPGDAVAELVQLALELAVAPAGVLARQAQDELDTCVGGGRPPASRAVVERPLPLDDFAMPAQQGGGRETRQTRERSGSLAARLARSTFSQREGRGCCTWRS